MRECQCHRCQAQRSRMVTYAIVWGVVLVVGAGFSWLAYLTVWGPLP